MNPYKKLPEEAFWRTAVASKSMFDILNLWSPKFNISQNSEISTFGSCFAQHIGNALRSRGFNWLISEKPPESLSFENAKKFNYNLFSARTGNIYTTSLLKQWTEWSLGKVRIPEEIWEQHGRFYDPFRPTIEPNGFASAKELKLSQEEAVKAFRRCIERSDFFVFTLGLTESWFNSEYGYEYPICPGTTAGEYKEGKHAFKNQRFEEIKQNLLEAISLIKQENKNIKFILTVSPVPLTATNTNKNVLVATMESKSILRSVSGELSNDTEYVDYFPSYEIINSPVFKGIFFEPNQRNVNSTGVNFVMDHFFSSLEQKFGPPAIESNSLEREKSNLENDTCEEELLDSFS